MPPTPLVGAIFERPLDSGVPSSQTPENQNGSLHGTRGTEELRAVKKIDRTFKDPPHIQRLGKGRSEPLDMGEYRKVRHIPLEKSK